MQVFFLIVIPIVITHINSCSVAGTGHIVNVSIGLFAFAKWIQIKEASVTQWNNKKKNYLQTGIFKDKEEPEK